MSSCGNPASEKDALMPRRNKFDKSRTCVKCKINTGNIVIRHAVYCKECFVPFVSSKFKRVLEPSVNPLPDASRRTKLKASGNLLVAFSGGLGSSVLLDLVYRSYCSSRPAAEGDGKVSGGKDHPRNERVWKKVAVCYVEVCNAFPGMRDRAEEVRAVVDRFPEAHFIPLRIENAFDNEWWASTGGKPSPLPLNVDLADEDLFVSNTPTGFTPLDSLRAYLSSLPTHTAITSSIQTLVRLLLIHTAKATESSHLLLGTCLTSLSISLISSISQGGGYSVREEAQEEWSSPTTPSTVRVIRPLRDVGMKECAAWAWWLGLRVVGKEKVVGSRQGIGGLTKEFIVGLEKDYPSTVSAIARTCGKLVSKDTSVNICPLCQRPAQRNVQEWKARISIRSFSETADETVTNGPKPSLTPHLCYACHTTLTSRSNRGAAPISKDVHIVTLPMWVKSRLPDPDHSENEVWENKKMNSTEMKSAIADFLLDD